MTTNTRIQPIERATNKTWEEWLKFMDGIDAKNLTHHQIATKVHEQLTGAVDNPGWWAQSVAVAYEQHIGRRMPGQGPDGTFQTSVSKATKLDMKKLMDTWAEFAAKDTEILGLVTAPVRVSGTDKRITWRTKAADGSSVIITSEPKTDGSASIIATQMGLQTSELNAQAKARWASILDRFLAVL